MTDDRPSIPDLVDLELQALLDFDALAAAETFTGNSYKSDEATMSFGFGLHVMNTEAREKALLDSDDTTFSDGVERYLRILAAEGFEIVWTMPFDGRDCTFGGNRHAEETLSVLFHPDGLLLKFDTFGGNRVNSAQVYFNWKPFVSSYEAHEVKVYDRETSTATGTETKLFPPHPHQCSGGWKVTDERVQDCVWSGHRDVREGLRFFLRTTRAKGNFLNPWPYVPFIQLQSYADYRSEERGYAGLEANKAQTAARIAQLPAHVRACIAPDSVPTAGEIATCEHPVTLPLSGDRRECARCKGQWAGELVR